MNSHVIISSTSERKTQEEEERKRRRERAIESFARFCERLLHAADWSTHYAQLKDMAPIAACLIRSLGVALVVGSGTLDD